jgi:hypothetical protein
MKTETFPTKIQEFASYLIRAIAWLIANKTRLGILDTDMEELNALYSPDTTEGTYMYCKKKYDEASARKDSVVTNNLKGVSDKVKAKLTKIYNDIPVSKWTDEDRTRLNRKTGLPHEPTTPTEPIKDVCIVDIEVNPNGFFNFGIRYRDDTKRYNKAPGADAVEVWWAIVESEYRKATGEMIGKVKEKCETYNDCTEEELFRKAKFTLSVDPLFKAFDLVCWVRWTNTVHSNLAGIWCGPYKNTIL